MIIKNRPFLQQVFWLSNKSTGVTDDINDGSVLFKCARKPRQCDSEPAWTMQDLETEAVKWNSAIIIFYHFTYCNISKCLHMKCFLQLIFHILIWKSLISAITMLPSFHSPSVAQLFYKSVIFHDTYTLSVTHSTWGKVIEKTWVREIDGVCTRGLQNTSARCYSLSKQPSVRWQGITPPKTEMAQ